MAWGTGAVLEVRTTGSNSNGGGFNTLSAGFLTDLQATAATSTSPVVSSASYNFVAGDVNNYLFISAGTNWIPGWYKITSVASGLATIAAGVGAVVAPLCYYTNIQGCASVTSPTGGTWAVDYSQSDTAIISNSLAVGNATTTITDSAATFTPAMIGNFARLSGGSGALAAGWYEITAYTNTTTITIDRAVASGTSIVIAVGGALADPPVTSTAIGSGNSVGNGVWVFVKSGTYTQTSTSNNITGGGVSLSIGGLISTRQMKWIGYSTNRVIGNNDTKPILRVGVAAGTYFSFNNVAFVSVENFNFDGNNATTNRALSAAGARCRVARCLFTGIFTGFACSFTNQVVLIEDCKFNCTGSNHIACSGNILRCEFTGLTTANTVSIRLDLSGTIADCVFYNNNGATVDFIQIFSSMTADIKNCTFYGGGTTRHGLVTALVSGTSMEIRVTNCLFANLTGYGIGSTNAMGGILVQNCAFYSCTSGAIQSTISQENIVGTVLLNATPFNNVGAGDLTLNNNGDGVTVLAGRQCRATALPSLFPSGTFSSYLDIGAIQHATPPLGLSVTTSGSDNVLVWDADSRATTYNILRAKLIAGDSSTVSGSTVLTYTVIASGVTGTTYTDVGAASTSYDYSIQGVP